MSKIHLLLRKVSNFQEGRGTLLNVTLTLIFLGIILIAWNLKQGFSLIKEELNILNKHLEELTKK